MHPGQPACLTGRTSQLIKRAPQPAPILRLCSFRPFTSRPFFFFLYIRSLWPCGDAHATEAMSPAGSFGTRWGRARPAGSWMPRQELRRQAEASSTRRERQRYSQRRRPPQGVMVHAGASSDHRYWRCAAPWQPPPKERQPDSPVSGHGGGSRDGSRGQSRQERSRRWLGDAMCGGGSSCSASRSGHACERRW
jgi:hypothetical protein